MVKTDHIKFIDEWDKQHAPKDHVWHPMTKKELRHYQEQPFLSKVGETLSSNLKNIPLIGEQLESQKNSWQEQNMRKQRKETDTMGYAGINLEDTAFLKTLDEPHY
ncbi:hypothetical protein FDP41_012692 [Naegleria fowleri]|uniref:Uncharacterized protein n=1 Tax=Naegleria fowleri TaxID=5763 RepID=A0A6A5C2Z6_NAEFO|nr:uncharacterized protein FDP41_012692 [Naegleria fowleri]KAF0980904.1 hypothetical protein FDP41_012692 [Naegleria fowleri]CAG4716605.1 unnamed protein product [Naegleria fowleri]